MDAGFVIPDAGPAGDAGCLDGCGEEDGGAGTGGGAGGGGGEGGGAAGGSTLPPDGPPCGCGTAPLPGLLVVALALALRASRTSRRTTR
jgi:hypothetical protein